MNKNPCQIVLQSAAQIFLTLILSSFAFADFNIQCGSFKNKNNATKYVQMLLDRDIKAFVYAPSSSISGKAPWHKVRIGPFATREAALERLRDLHSSGHTHFILVDDNPDEDTNLPPISGDISDKNIKVAPLTHGKSRTEPNSDKTAPSVAVDTAIKNRQPVYMKHFKTDEDVDDVPENLSPTSISIPDDKNHATIESGEIRPRPGSGQADHAIDEKIAKTHYPPVSRGIFKSNETEKSKPEALLSDSAQPNKQAVKPEPDPRNVSLKWEAGQETDLAGYKIYYGTRPGPPYTPDKKDYADEGPPPITVGKDVTALTLHGLSPRKDYYFSITSFNRAGLESDYSPEIFYPKTALQRAVPHDAPENAEIAAPSPATNKNLMSAISKTPPTDAPPAAPKSPTGKTPPPVLDGTTVIPEEEFQVSPGDIISIDIPGQKEMSQAYDVDPSGNIYLLTIGKVQVKDLTAASLDEYLTKKVVTLISKGEKVSTKILERRRYIYIQGGVRYPGWYRVAQKMDVDTLIETAGGLLPGADYSRIRLKRETPDGYMEIGVKGDITLHPNDILFVPPPKDFVEKIDNGDLLFISIPQRQAPGRVPSQTDITDLSISLGRNQTEVDRNGYVYVPDYGHFDVNNRTPEEVKKDIIDRLPKYLAILQKVEVGIVEKRHFIRVSGHVTNPGLYNIPEMDNAQVALNKAGNAVDGAVMSDIAISRKMKGRTEQIKINLYQYNITGDPRLLTPIHEDDDIFVPISASFGNIKRVLQAWNPPEEKLEKDVKKKVRIFGAVNNPGVYEHFEDMDLLDLMVQASGGLDSADLSKVLIIKNNVVQSQFNLTEFLKYEGTTKGSLRIPKIDPGDTVYVKYLEWKTAEPKEDKVLYVTGEVKTPGQFKLWDQMTVLQAIALAGGLTEWADAKHITIVRTVSGKQENIPFNYYKGVAGKLHELNVYLHADDVVVVP